MIFSVEEGDFRFLDTKLYHDSFVLKQVRSPVTKINHKRPGKLEKEEITQQALKISKAGLLSFAFATFEWCTKIKVIHFNYVFLITNWWFRVMWCTEQEWGGNGKLKNLKMNHRSETDLFYKYVHLLSAWEVCA